MIAKRLIVQGLERLCTRTHWLTHHRPLVWVMPHPCWFTTVAMDLDDRWGTGVWK